jgi:hypothetical protein
MTATVTFTQAQVRRAVRAAESAGLTVRKLTINADGSITIETGPAMNAKKPNLASWHDV